MQKLSISEIEGAARQVYQLTPPTPQYAWPLLGSAIGCEVWVKHENHTRTGAFKVRGGIVFLDWLKRTHPDVRGIVTATRGNHGQAQTLGASLVRLEPTIVVPQGNCAEKNSAMRAFGARVIEFGDDFDQARGEARRLAEEEGLYPVPAFHREIVRGVATYALEFFSNTPNLDTVYVPIGCGSGVCGVISARDALGLKTKVVGVVSEHAQGAKLSFESGRITETDSAATFADGMAVRVPVEEAFEVYSRGMDRVVSVSEDEIADAIRLYYKCTHNLAEGAGAAPLAALHQEREIMKDRRVGVILTGGNIDMDMMKMVLSGETPRV